MATNEYSGEILDKKLLQEMNVVEKELQLTSREKRRAEKERKFFEKSAEKELQKMRMKYSPRWFFTQNIIGKKIAKFFLNRNLKRVSSNLENGNYKEAKKFVERAFRWKPDSVACWFYRSILSKEEGNWAQSVRALTCVLLLNPEDTRARSIRAAAFQVLKKRTAALADWLDCLLCEPENADYWYHVGLLYWFADENEKAKYCLLKALSFAPKNSHALFVLGRISEEIPDFETACSFFELARFWEEERFGEDFVETLEREAKELPILKKVRAMDTQNTETETENSVEVEIGSEMEEDAEARRKRILAKFPDISAQYLEEYELILSTLMMIPCEEREADEIRKLSEKLLVLNRNTEQALLMRAATEYEKEKLETAYFLFLELRKQYPQNVMNYWFTGEILQKLGRYEEAIEDLKVVYENQIQVTDTIHGMLMCLQHLERRDELFHFCTKVILDGNATSRVYNSRGMVSLMRQNLKEAEADFRQSLRIEPKDYWGTMNLVVTLFAGNRYEELLPYSEDVLEQNPNNMDCRRIRVTALQVLERFEEAKVEIEVLYENDQENVDIMIAAAQIYRQCGELDTAEEYIDCALQRAPKNQYALSERLDLCILNRNPKSALETVETLLAIKPECVDYRTKQGACLTQLERFDEALEVFNSVIEQEPDNDEALFGRGECKLRNGQFEAAIVDFQKVRKLNPTSIHPLVLSAEAKVKLGLLEPALEDLEGALEIMPKHDELRLQKIAGLVTLKRYEEAFNFVDGIVRQEPENRRMRFQRGSLHTVFSRYEEALADFEYVVEQDSENFEPLFACAVALNSLFRTDEALEKLNEVLKIVPDFVPALTEKAVILNNMGKVAEGLKLLEKVLELEPDNTRVLNLRGTVRANEHEFKAAIVDFRRVLDLDPDYVPAMNNLGHMLSLLGKTEEGLEYLNSAIEMSPTWPRPYLNRALLFVRMKQLEEAENDTQKAIDVAQENGDEDSVVDAVNLKRQIQELNEFLSRYENGENDDDGDETDFLFNDEDELDVDGEFDELEEFGEDVYSDDSEEVFDNDESELDINEFLRDLMNKLGHKLNSDEEEEHDQHDDYDEHDDDEVSDEEDSDEYDDEFFSFLSDDDESDDILMPIEDEEEKEDFAENDSKNEAEDRVDWSSVEEMDSMWDLFFENVPGAKEVFAHELEELIFFDMSKKLISELKDISEQGKSMRELVLERNPIIREMFNHFVQDLFSSSAEQIPWHFLDLKIAEGEEPIQKTEMEKKPTSESTPELREDFQLISALWRFVSDEEDREPTITERVEKTETLDDSDDLGDLDGETEKKTPKMSYSFVMNSPDVLNQLEPEMCRSVTDLPEMEGKTFENWAEPPMLASCRYQENRERFFELLTLISETLNEKAREVTTPELSQTVEKCKEGFHFMMEKIMEKIMDQAANDIHLVVVNFMPNSIVGEWEKCESEKLKMLEDENLEEDENTET